MLKYLLNHKYKVLLITLMSLVIGAILSIIFFKKNTYGYNVSTNYNYNFQNITPIKIQNQSFSVPQSIEKNQTSFLKIKLSNNLFSNIFQPYIDITSNELSQRQYFEHGSSGDRYINLTAFIELGATYIKLNTHFTAIENQNGFFTTFINEDLTKAKILIIAPHPDDAEIAAFGLYEKYHKNSFILTILAGDGLNLINENTKNDFLYLGKTRTDNSLKTPLIGNINPNNILNLGYFDGTLKNMFENKSKNFSSTNGKTSDINTFRNQNTSIYKNLLTGTSNWNSLINNLKKIITQFNPTVIVSPYPKIDIHSDHQYTTKAIIQALKELNINKGNLFLYSNHYVTNEYYPYGKKGSSITLPPNFDNAIYFKSIFSNTLKLEDQIKKQKALASMYALQNQITTNPFQEFKRDILEQDFSYFRRAVRTNEIFFVCPFNEIDKIDF